MDLPRRSTNGARLGATQFLMFSHAKPLTVSAQVTPCIGSTRADRAEGGHTSPISGGRAAQRLASGPFDVITSHMSRLLILLIMVVFATTNGVAAPFAMCQHVDTKAHAAALASSDTVTAVAAHSEELAAAAADKQGLLADAAAGALTSVPLPSGVGLPTPTRSAAIDAPAPADSRLASRAIRPLLDPPLV